MHFICTNLLRHTICALYLCKVCSAQRIRIVDFSAHVALFVCELLGDLQTLPPAVTQSCPREMGIIRTRSSGRRHFEGTLKPSDHQLFLGSRSTSKVSPRLCDGSGGVWQKNLLRDYRPFAFRLVRY